MSACLFMQPRPVCLRVAPPTGSWVIPCQASHYLRKMPSRNPYKSFDGDKLGSLPRLLEFLSTWQNPTSTLLHCLSMHPRFSCVRTCVCMVFHFSFKTLMNAFLLRILNIIGLLNIWNILLIFNNIANNDPPLNAGLSILFRQNTYLLWHIGNCHPGLKVHIG